MNTKTAPESNIARRLTPPELARLYGVKVQKIHGWIRSGELIAFNAANRRGGRPRWLIPIEEVKAFEARRSAGPVQRAPRQQRRKLEGIVEFYK